MNKLTLAYLAGILDADGTIGIKKSTYAMRVIMDSTQPTYSERIHIRQVERAALDLFVETFGGAISIEDANCKRGRSLFRWGLTDQKAANALKQLLPFLRIKKAQAENCLSLRLIKTKSKKARVAKGRGHVGSAKRTEAFTLDMETHYQRAKTLNHVGV